MSTTPTNLLHGIGELLELEPAVPVAQINEFLALGWILLRVADGRHSYILGWLRERGEAELPAWYEAQVREREALLAALDHSALATDVAELELEPADP